MNRIARSQLFDDLCSSFRHGDGDGFLHISVVCFVVRHQIDVTYPHHGWVALLGRGRQDSLLIIAHTTNTVLKSYSQQNIRQNRHTQACGSTYKATHAQTPVCGAPLQKLLPALAHFQKDAKATRRFCASVLGPMYY